MTSLLQTTWPRLTVALTTLAASLLMAETLYKLHSFSVELACFAATWAALDAVGRAVFLRNKRL